MEKNKLTVFVGSSSEAKDHDVKIRRILELYGIEAIPWSDVFYPGDFGLESLLKISNEVDGSIIIATSDDKTWYRGNEYFTPRDNMLFEMGLFIRSLGRYRTGLIVVKNSDSDSPKIPTDLAGLNIINYDVNQPANNEHKINNWINQLKLQLKTKIYFDDTLNILRDNYYKIPDSWKDEIHEHILTPFKQLSIDALRGEFTLNAIHYYNSIISELNRSTNCTIIRAISLLPSEIWKKDEFQNKYSEQNFIAIQNGALIKRIFVCSEAQRGDFNDIIREQVEKGVKVKLLSPKSFAEFTNLEDCLIISCNSKITSYLTNQSVGFPTSLGGCRLNVNYNTGEELISLFDRAWNIAKEPIIQKVPKSKKSFSPPGKNMQLYKLEKPVISCEEAAKERKIPLQNELKTIILTTNFGFYAIHLPGDGILSLRSIKNVLETKEASLADPEDLFKLGLTAGTVCAVLEPVWSMKHLISKRVLTLDFVATNNGTKTAYFKFDPVIMTKTKNYLIGNYEKNPVANEPSTDNAGGFRRRAFTKPTSDKGKASI